MNFPLYQYRFELIRVIDGDTIEVMLDLGIETYRRELIRLYGVNTPEKRGATKEAAMAAQAFTTSWLIGTFPFHLDSRSYKPREKYGRILGVVYRYGDPVSLNDALLKAGHAVELVY